MGTGYIRRPIVGIAIMFVAGTWFGLTIEFSFLPLLAICCGMWLLALAVIILEHLVKPGRRRHAALAVAAILSLHSCVLLSAMLSAATSVSAGIGNVIELAGGDGNVEIVGMISGDPEGKTYDDGTRNYRFPFQVETVLRDGREYDGGGAEINVFLKRVSRGIEPEYGDKWRIGGRLRKFTLPAEDDSPGLQRHPFMEIRRISFASVGGKMGLISARNGSALVKDCFDLRKSATGYLSAGIGDFGESVTVIQSLVLGYRGAMPAKVRQTFIDTGTLHIFAVSGSHVAVIAGLVIFVLRALKISLVRWFIFLGPILVVYTIATGASASAVRSCLMAIIFFAGPFAGRRPDVLSAIACAAVVLLAFSPPYLLDAGFILSFAVVIGMVVFFGPFVAAVKHLWEPDPMRVGPEPVILRIWHWVLRGLLGTFAISCSAWLVSTPITVALFGRASLISVLSNIVVVPLASIIVTAGCLSLVLAPCLGILGEVFNHANVALAWTLLTVTDLMAKAPFSCVETGPVPAWFLPLWYVLLGLLAWCGWRRVNGGGIPAVRGPSSNA